MPCSGCSALHGVNPNFKKLYLKFVLIVKIRRKVFLVFVEHLYEHFLMKGEDADNTKEIIWIDGPNSEFKNKYTVELL